MAVAQHSVVETAVTARQVARRWLSARHPWHLASYLFLLGFLVRALRRRVYVRICSWLQLPVSDAVAPEESESQIQRLKKGTHFNPTLYRLGEEIGRCSIGGKIFECVSQIASAITGSTAIVNGAKWPALGSGLPQVVFVVPQARITSSLELLLDLQHASILAHQCIYADDASFYIVADRPLGPNLLDWFVSKNCYCGEVVARTLMQQLLAALVYLQEARVLHRDVKLEAMFFDLACAEPEWSATLKLTDFTGYLHLPHGQLCCHAAPVGTLMYAAPEALEESYYISSDCFSAGVALFMLLVSAPPFASDSKFMYLRDVQSQDWRLAIDVAGASTPVKGLLTGLLEPDASKRYTAASALAHRWLQDERYAKAADKVNEETCSSEDGGYALRFLKECGTPMGASCSMSFGGADNQLDSITEGDNESRGSPRPSPRPSPPVSPPLSPRAALRASHRIWEVS